MRRGYTLIELMVALALLFVGVDILVSHFHQYHKASQRTVSIEALTRVLDQEMERVRSCPDAACVEGLATTTATTAGVSLEANSWIRARVKRTIERGPNGTYKVTIRAQVPGITERELVALIVAG